MGDRQTIYFDMDGVLADYCLAAAECGLEPNEADKVPGLFSTLRPMPGALEAVAKLSEVYECHILSTAPWLNPSAWSDKVEWTHRYFGVGKESPFYKRITITHDKAIYKGDYLIDDRDRHGVLEFAGKWIHFGSDEFPDWNAALAYLLPAKSDSGNALK